MATNIVCILFGHKWERHDPMGAAAYWKCARCGRTDPGTGVGSGGGEGGAAKG